MKAPVAHDGYARVAWRLLGWGTALAAVCLVPQLMLFVMEQGHQPSDRAWLDMQNIHLSLRAYREHTGAWPPEASWSEVLIKKGLLEREPLDPWDHPYRYRLESVEGGELEPRVTSLGSDGAADTEDDLVRAGMGRGRPARNAGEDAAGPTCR